MAHPILPVLIDEVQQTKGVMASATTLISGFGAKLEAAIAAALAAGASAAELEPLTQLEAELETERTALAAAVAANP
jgi:D-aminopeptidase